jgi:hypothetical protein
MNKKEEKKEEKVSKKEFKLPKYLRLGKGAMFFDEGAEDSSGVRIYSVKKVFVSREMKTEKYMKDGKETVRVIPTPILEDEYKNKNLTDYGKTDSSLPWYFDTTRIPPDKLSRILTAYKYGILVEADPTNPPKEEKLKEEIKDFGFKENGDRIFIGKNKEIFAKLQNLNFNKLREFINSTPKTTTSRENLFCMYDYEQKGYNPLGRGRFEVLELIKKKLNEFGPSMSSIRVNEE